MEKDIETWNEKGLGTKQSDEKSDCISNLRFDDDVLMMATSLKQLGLQKSTEAQGLVIHSDETQILTNQKTNRTREVEIDGILKAK